MNALTARHRANGWRSTAVRIYRNWLAYLHDAKAQRSGMRVFAEPQSYGVILKATP